MSARQEKVREALDRCVPATSGLLAPALAEVEEWETRLSAVAQAWFDFDQEALDTLLGPYREEEA